MSSNIAPMIATAVRRQATEQEERRRLGLTGRSIVRSHRHGQMDIDEEAIDILARAERRGARGRQLIANIVEYAQALEQATARTPQ